MACALDCGISGLGSNPGPSNKGITMDKVHLSHVASLQH